MGVKQHLMSLLRIGAQEKGAATGQFEVGDLQLGALARDNRPVFRPVELESLAGRERQGYEYATTGSLLLALPGGLPVAGESRHAIV
jgi:hypothetical protein